MKYLLSIYQPDGPPPPPEFLAPIIESVNAVNEELQAAGVWVFSGGLHPQSTATVLRAQGDTVLMTDGPFAEGKEFLGGITIIEVDDLDAALGWSAKLAKAVSLPIEVRPFQ